MNRRRFLTGAGAVGVVLLAGCTGGDGGGGTTPTETPTATSTATATATTTEAGTPTPLAAQEKYPDYEWAKLDDAQPVATSSITMSGFAFHPLVAAVTPGTEVTVTNEDSTRHTLTIPRLGVDESLTAGASTAVTVETAGTYDYVCELHPPGMLGRLVVTTSTPTPTATPTPTPTDGGTDGTPTPTPTPTDGGGYY